MNRSYGIRLMLTLLTIGMLFLPTASSRAEAPVAPNMPNSPIQHLVVLMQENHTFDNYFGTYPGAEGIPAGVCMPVNPTNAANKDCVTPYHIGDRLIDLDDPDHSLDTFLMQYNNGKLDGFVYALNQRNQNGALTMGYYDGRDVPYYWNLADEYVLYDHFFSSEHGGSFTNHMYWVTGQLGGRRPSADGYQNIPTIFDRLEERGISWKFYVQNYDASVNYRLLKGGGTDQLPSQVIWVPLLSMDRFIDDPKLASHIVDMSEYYKDLENGTLPAVSYIVPSGASEHPPGNIQSGQKFVKSLIQSLMRSSVWGNSAFLLSYDDWGGWYDHVVPPQVDQNGYGYRVPAILVSPYARRGYIDNTVLDFTSILKFIEENWNLQPLTQRDASAKSFASGFDFAQAPRDPVYLPFDRVEKKVVTSGPRRVVIYVAYGAAVLFAFSILMAAGVVSHKRQVANYAKAEEEPET